MKHEEDYLMLKPTLRVGNGNRENQNSPCVRLVNNMNLEWRELLQASHWADQVSKRERDD